MSRCKLCTLFVAILLVFSMNYSIIHGENPNIQLVVFDFDSTITDYIHRDYEKLLSPENEAAFRDLVQSLVAQKVHVAVATFGSSPQKRLDRIFGEETPFYEENIQAPPDQLSEEEKAHRKNYMLKNLQDYYNIRDNHSVLLIDDNVRNIEKAKEAGYQTYLVSPRCKGMSNIAPDITQLFAEINQ